ncbi:hypothetical protein CA7LBN_000176 [Candidozyma auris]|uniref:Golgi apparatus membrane protein TVP18 n=1 Tax=Candidozyma auris TaxID=498019 RepID=A0A8F2VY86_CANAR|nr:hypothetical protein CA7LBN_000176 [[Candida] auris]
MVNVGNIFSNIFSGFSADFKKKNFSLYGQWLGILNIFLCLALGIANIFHFNLVIIFSIICIVQGLVVVFVEIPFLLKICPLTDTFTNFVRNFDENWPRCGFYLLMAAIQYLSLVISATSLLVVAIVFTLASACYLFAALKHQEYLKTSISVTGNNDDLESQVAHNVVRNVFKMGLLSFIEDTKPSEVDESTRWSEPSPTEKSSESPPEEKNNQRSDSNGVTSLSYDEVNDNADELIELRGEGRYFGVIDPEQGATVNAQQALGPLCDNCHKRGHIRSKCKTVICHKCGKKNQQALKSSSKDFNGPSTAQPSRSGIIKSGKNKASLPPIPTKANRSGVIAPKGQKKQYQSSRNGNGVIKPNRSGTLPKNGGRNQNFQAFY